MGLQYENENVRVIFYFNEMGCLMSYDLFLTRNEPPLTREIFKTYFQERPNYTELEDGTVIYENTDTDVYFYFNFNEADCLSEEDADESERGEYILFNINYNRPSFFAREAAIELAILTETLNLDIDDPQINGIKGNRYDSDAFLEAWKIANRWADGCMSEGELLHRVKLPAQTVHESWQWNYACNELGEELAFESDKYVFVPKISVFTNGKENCLGVVWGNGIPIHLPKCVDKVIIVRREDFLPEQLQNQGLTEDMVIMNISLLKPLLERYDCGEFEDAYCLDYDECPVELAVSIRALQSEEKHWQMVSWEYVLETESNEAV